MDKFTGEGGAVITNNYKIYENIKIVRSHNIIKKPNKGIGFMILKVLALIIE